MLTPFYFTRIGLPSMDFDAVTERYRTWLIGTGRGPHFRKRRLGTGVRPNWTAETLASTIDLKGGNDLQLACRHDGATSMFRLLHRDSTKPQRLWYNVIRIVKDGGGSVVEHGAAVSSTPDDDFVDLGRFPPTIITNLLDAARPKIVPRDLVTPKLRFTADEVPELVDHVLLDGSRGLPYLLFTRRNDSGELVVNADKLIPCMSGLAVVLVADTPQAGIALTKKLTQKGLDPKLGCSDGGVRLYRPGLSRSSQPSAHPLLIRSRLESLVGEREEFVSHWAYSWLVRGNMPPRFFDLIEDADAAARQRNLATAVGSQKDLADLQTGLALAREELEAQARVLSEQAAKSDTLEMALMEAEERHSQELAELQEELWKERLKANTLTDQLAASGQGSGESRAINDVRDRIVEAYQDQETLEGTLEVLAVLFPDRLVVLESALKSANRSPFADVRTAQRLMAKLVTDYFDVLASGRPDKDAKEVFGKNTYSANEAETLSRAGEKRRTFTYKGKGVLMERHLKIGQKDSKNKTLRIHFEWMADEKKLVVGHCGEHLPL